mgnify:FL=1
MPTEKWLVKWKRNRSNRGEEIVYSQEKALQIAEEKKHLGYKVKMKKIPRR